MSNRCVVSPNLIQYCVSALLQFKNPSTSYFILLQMRRLRFSLNGLEVRVSAGLHFFRRLQADLCPYLSQHLEFACFPGLLAPSSIFRVNSTHLPTSLLFCPLYFWPTCLFPLPLYFQFSVGRAVFKLLRSNFYLLLSLLIY